MIYPDDIIIPLILDRKATPEIVEEAYKLQKSNKEYQKLLNHCTVIGNWVSLFIIYFLRKQFRMIMTMVKMMVEYIYHSKILVDLYF